MPKLNYAPVRTAVYQPHVEDGSPILHGLHGIGFRDLTFFSSLGSLQNALAGDHFDFLVADVSGPADPAFGFISKIRLGELSKNPFMVITVISFSAEPDVVTKAMHCGADDFIKRPVSATGLGSRARQITISRKQFVVTAEYVGPDRHAVPLANRALRTFEVPNSLWMKARYGHMHDEVVQKINKDRIAIYQERIRRIAHYTGLFALFIKDLKADAAESLRQAHNIDKLLSLLRAASNLSHDLASQTTRACADRLIALIENTGTLDMLVTEASSLHEMALDLWVATPPTASREECEAEIARSHSYISQRAIYPAFSKSN